MTRFTTRLAGAAALVVLVLLPVVAPVGAVGMPPADIDARAALTSGPDSMSVDRLYRAFFLREPDAAGLAYWRNLVDGGRPLSAIALQFTQSAEFVARYGDVTDHEFVTLVYRNVMDRDPDAGGFAHWSAALTERRLSRGGMMTAFSDSAEFKARTGLVGGPACRIQAPPAGVHPHYGQECVVLGVTIRASAAVSPEALHRAARMVGATLVTPQLVETMRGYQIVIIPTDRPMTAIPELANINQIFPHPTGDWDSAARGVFYPGGRQVSAGEENMLCHAQDRHSGESTALRGWAQAIDYELGMSLDWAWMEPRVQAWETALDAGRWPGGPENQLDLSDHWTLGVLAYFGVDAGPVASRAGLATYDPPLFALIDDALRNSQWRPPC